MAERIPIMLALCDVSAEASDLSDEAVLDRVFSERGWDASVIIPLDQIQNGSTDELCLSGISGPFVLFSRKSLSAAAEHLSRLRIDGTIRGVLENSESVVLGSAARSIFFFQLSNRMQFEKSLQKVREIQSSIHTRVFSLQLPIAGRAPKQNEHTQRESNHLRIVDGAAESIHSSVAKEPNHNDADLDRLLDELDQSNI